MGFGVVKMRSLLLMILAIASITALVGCSGQVSSEDAQKFYANGAKEKTDSTDQPKADERK